MGLNREGGSALRKIQALSLADLQYHQSCEIVPRSCFLRASPFKVTNDVYLHPAFHSIRALYQHMKGRRTTNKCLLFIVLLGLQVTLRCLMFAWMTL